MDRDLLYKLIEIRILIDYDIKKSKQYLTNLIKQLNIEEDLEEKE